MESSKPAEFEWGQGKTLARAAEILRSEGARVLWYRVLGETVYRRMILFERRLDEPASATAGEGEISASLLQPGDIEEYVRFRSGPSQEEVQARIQQGQLCFLARWQGALGHAVWAATGSVRVAYLNCGIELTGDEAYIYDSYTAPEFRRRGLTAARADAMLRYFRERSYVRVFSLVMPENPGGIGSTLNAGYRRAGVIGRVEIGGWRRYFQRTAADVRPVVIRPSSPVS